MIDIDKVGGPTLKDALHAGSGLLGAILGFCFPAVPGYAFGVLCTYFFINRFTPVVAYVFRDIKKDLTKQPQATEVSDAR